LSVNFVHPTDPAINTQRIERLWGTAKWRNKRHRGTKRCFLKSYLAEFMCRQISKALKIDFFTWIITQIVESHIPLNNIV
jgi:hypothetical protein